MGNIQCTCFEGAAKMLGIDLPQLDGSLGVDPDLDAKLEPLAQDLANAAKKGDKDAILKVLENEELSQLSFCQKKRLVNWADEGFFNYTALHMAAAKGHEKICEILLQNGAKIDPRSSSDETPLLMAARAKHKVTTDILLNKGADPNAKTNYKEPAVAKSAQQFLDDMNRSSIEV